jgi:hypothetical protein
MEGPANPSGSHVVGADVTGCRSFAFSDASTLNEKILVDGAGARGDEKCIADVASESNAQVNEARVTERVNRAPRARIERVQTSSGGKEDPSVAIVSPVRNAAVDV